MNDIAFPVIELIDRFVIAQIKWNKTKQNHCELDFYNLQIQSYDLSTVQSFIDELTSVHLRIWDLEKELKTGKEYMVPLSELGRRAIAIRDLNNKRIKLKNAIARELKCSVQEIKQDHLSQ